MIIPFSKGYQQPEREPPDEAMMLMALAHMKQIGRIPQADGTKVAGDVINLDRYRELETKDPDGQLNKDVTRDVLGRALGMKAKVLPIKPEGK